MYVALGDSDSIAGAAVLRTANPELNEITLQYESTGMTYVIREIISDTSNVMCLVDAIGIIAKTFFTKVIIGMLLHAMRRSFSLIKIT